MEIESGPFAGLKIVTPFRQADQRGQFVKTFHVDLLPKLGLKFELREEFYSVSQKNVLRGMHFQTPPHAHQKLVYCVSGKILDVLVDLRKGQPTYRQHFSLTLSSENPKVLWIPPGIAHGFLSLEDDTCVIYKTDCEYSPDHDLGVHWASFGFNWPVSEKDVLISPRDQNHSKVTDYESPF